MNVILLLVVLTVTCAASAIYISPKALRLLAVWCLTRASYIEEMLEAKSKADHNAGVNKQVHEELCRVRR